MSTAVAQIEIKFIAKSGTYTSLLQSPSGDLYQDYSGDSSDAGTIAPDFSTTQPTLYFICTSSRVAEGVVTPDAVAWYFNGNEISFDSSTLLSTGTYAGYFKKVYPGDVYPYYGIQILKNLVELSGFASAAIKASATVSNGTASDTIQATYNIRIQQATTNGYHVTIAAGDTNNFVITSKSGSCVLKAMVYQGSSEIASGLTYKWQKMEAGSWNTLSNTAQTLTVSADDIDTYGEYRVVVSLNGAEIGTDIQGVMDVSDPYDIQPNPSPEDHTIVEGVNDSVTFTPTVVTRGTTTAAPGTFKFYFTATDAVGNYLNSDRTTLQESFVVTEDMCIQAGYADVSLMIEAKAV